MKQEDFEWTSNTFEHAEKGLEGVDQLTIKALGVVQKHFMVPLSEFDLGGWNKQDHYRHHISELQDNEGDAVWIKPWIVGQWLDGKESILHFEPAEFMEEVSRDIEHKKDHHKRGAIFGIYFTVARKEENWDAVFAFRLDDKPNTDKLQDVPIREALCLSINGDHDKVEQWLDWAYTESA